MKLIVTLTISILFALNAYSQITTISTKEKEDFINTQKYDSLASLDIDNALLHKGQTLFLKGTSYAKENNYYDIFFTKIIKEYITDTEPYIYKPIPGKREGEIVSSYSELVGRYYKVLSVELEKKAMYDTTYWLQLLDDKNDTLYYHMTMGLNDFVTLGYYEKMKQTFVGKYFYSQGTLTRERVDSKETVEFPSKTKFKCIDIAVNIGEDQPIFAVLENEKYGKIKGEIFEGKTLRMFISESARDEYIKKYGAKFGNSVAKRSIEIGMNRNMVRDAWGNPDDINTTTGNYGTHEQWVYGFRYIYFKNGIVTSTQF